MLFIDVNFGNGTQRIVIFEGDTAEGLAEKFAHENSLDTATKQKLVGML